MTLKRLAAEEVRTRIPCDQCRQLLSVAREVAEAIREKRIGRIICQACRRGKRPIIAGDHRSWESDMEAPL